MLEREREVRVDQALRDLRAGVGIAAGAGTVPRLLLEVQTAEGTWPRAAGKEGKKEGKTEKSKESNNLWLQAVRKARAHAREFQLESVEGLQRGSELWTLATCFLEEMQNAKAKKAKKAMKAMKAM